MGYKIPPPDFTIPPVNYNIAADIGKAFAAGITRYGDAIRAEKAKAEKIKKENSKARNTILLNQKNQKTSFNKKLQEIGISDDTNKSDDLFDQFGKEVNSLGEQALEAKLIADFSEFDDDDTTSVTDALNLTDEQKKLYVKDGRISRSNLLDIVKNFDIYTDMSMEKIGGLLADTKTLLNPVELDKAIVVGDRNTGQQFANTVALTNVGIGGNGSVFDGNGNSTATRTLEREGMNNFILSKVTIPGNSDYLKDNITVLQDAEANGNLDKSIVKNSDGSYTFTSRIPLDGYASEGGMDLVVEKASLMKPGDTLEEAGVYKGQTWSDTLVDLNTVQTTEEVGDNLRTTKFNLINMSQAKNNPVLTDQINTNYGLIFTTDNYTDEQRDQYLLDLGLTKSFADLSKEKNHENFIKNVMRDKIFDTFLTSEYQNGLGGQQTLQIDDDNKSYDAVLAQAVSAGMIDPSTLKPYEAGKKGQILYALADENIKPKPTDSTPSKSDTRRRFGEFKKDLDAFKIAGSVQLPNTGGNTLAWNGSEYILYEKNPSTGQVEPKVKTEAEVKTLLDKYD